MHIACLDIQRGRKDPVTKEWIVKPSKPKRTLASIDKYVSSKEMLKTIKTAKSWDYNIDMDRMILRDKALMALLYLTCGRINEVLKLEKKQFDFSDDDVVIIRDFLVSKRKERQKKTETNRIDLPLPLKGELAPFTEIALNYLRISQEKLFNFGTCRAWQIVNHATGLWCHYFRSQRLSQTINLIRSTDGTAKIFGIKNPQTISHYYKGTWKDFKAELLK